MNLDDEELKATKNMYKGLTKYNVDISGEDKDKVIEILNRYDELIEENKMLKSKRQLEIDIAEEVVRWKGKYHLLSRKLEAEND